jgi:hypothetical protein
MMASEDKNIKANSAPENEAPPEKKSTSGTEPSKADGGELAVAFRFETPASRERGAVGAHKSTKKTLLFQPS